MSEQPTELHLGLEELVDYFRSDALPEKQDLVEQHLAVCDACTELGRQVYASTLLIDRWSKGGGHSKLARQILYPALLTLIERTSDPALVERLRNWANVWSGMAEGALRMTIEASTKASRIITEGMEDFLVPGARWQFALATAHTPVRGESDVQTVSLALAPGTPQARVAVSGESGEVEVRVDHLSSDQQAPLVILTSVAKGFEPQVNELRRAPETVYWIARFDGLEPGEYVVALEPMT
jgi:hypothetical protein